MRHLPSRLTLSFALALGSSAWAVEPAGSSPTHGDPLQSPECSSALESLRVQEAAAASAVTARAALNATTHADGARPPDAALQASRRHAASACLASRADEPVAPRRFAQPPIGVAPIAVPPMAVARPSMPAATSLAPLGTAPARPVDRPTSVLACDTGGCWANDGTRLNRVGPNLSGSRGLCTLQGTLLQCP